MRSQLCDPPACIRTHTIRVCARVPQAVAPAAISQGSFIIAGAIVLMAGIAGVVYVKTQW